MMRVKTMGPKMRMVLKMNSCPTAEQMERSVAWRANSEWTRRKLRHEKKTPRKRRELTVKTQEKMFTPNIIWMEETLYWVNTSACQFELKLSNSM